MGPKNPDGFTELTSGVADGSRLTYQEFVQRIARGEPEKIIGLVDYPFTASSISLTSSFVNSHLCYIAFLRRVVEVEVLPPVASLLDGAYPCAASDEGPTGLVLNVLRRESDSWAPTSY